MEVPLVSPGVEPSLPPVTGTARPGPALLGPQPVPDRLGPVPSPATLNFVAWLSWGAAWIELLKGFPTSPHKL